MNNNKKKIIIFFMLMSYILTLISFRFDGEHIEANAENDKPDYYQAIMEKQRRAVEANELLCSEFDFASRHPFPDDYAGDYISEDGKLHIFVSSVDGADRYSSILSDYSDVIVCEIKENSYNELIDAAEKAAGWMEDNYDVDYFGPDIKNNGIVFWLKNERTKDNEEKLLALFLNIEGDYYYSFNNRFIKVNIEWNSESTDEVSYPGASFLGKTSYNDIETMTCNGYKNNILGFVTCGHGQTIGGMMYSSGNFIGVTSYISYPTLSNPDVYGDFSFINSVSVPGTTITSSKYCYNLPGNTQFMFLGTVSFPALGTVMYKYGMTSGKTVVCVDYQYLTNSVVLSSSVTGHIYGLSKAHIITGTSAGGDSGGPYVYEQKIGGVHRASNVASGGTDVWFTPFAYVQSAGVSAVTN